MFGSAATVSISDDRLDEVIEELCRALYREAEPGMDYDEVEKPCPVDGYDWHELHYMDDDEQKELMNQVCEDMDIPEDDRAEIISSVLLQYGPNGNRDSVMENRRDAGLASDSNQEDDGQ